MAPKSLCLTTAFAPAPAFLGGSCPLGCSLSAPATGGFSVVSPQYIRYAAGSEKEKRAGGRLHGGTIAHPFVFCKGGGAEAGRGFLVWPAPSFSGGSGLACAVVPPGPPSNVFRNRGTPPVPPAGAAPPAPLLGEMRKAPSFHLAHRPTLFGTGGLTILPRKQRPLRPAWGRRGTGTEAPGGAWERGMGPLRSAIQHGHSAVIAQSSAVIARS